jgi:ATP-dependent helicase/nuclease subunit A
MSLTTAQKEAIAARGNVLVVAGAGTGKTRTLVERCLNCLLEESPPASLDQILMVTFTEAAAAEMRQRVRTRLEEQLKRTPDALHWNEQVALFDSAHIGTLHSFCLQLVRSHFYELELDPQMTVLAEEEARLLADETLTSVLQGHYAGRTPGAEAVQQLIQLHGAGSDQPVRALVLRLHHYTQTLPDPAGWFQEQMGKFASPEPKDWEEWLLSGFHQWREEWLPQLEADSQGVIAAQCAAALRDVALNASRQVMAKALERMAAATSAPAHGGKTAWLKAFKEFDADAGFLLSLAAADGKVDPLTEDWSWVRSQMTTLLRLAQEFDDAFSRNKRELGLLDFHDLEQHALRLLWDRRTRTPTRIAQQWRRKLRWVFVDEYQDINAAQDKIVEMLSGEGARANRFLVGDVKQSIYRFRLANPAIFQNYAASWGNGRGHVIPLVENFRSRECLLEFFNSLFGRIMRPALGGMRYDEMARLKFGAPEERQAVSAAAGGGPSVELHVRLMKKATGAAGEGAAKETAEVLELEEADQEARLVALRLRELKSRKHPIWDEIGSRFRPVDWDDMVVLLRSPANKAERYAREFSRLNIPLTVQRSGFYESVEISDLVNLLKALDNPLQDLPVLAVLHSPLVGLTVNELATIRLAGKGPFWTTLVLWADRGERGMGGEERDSPARSKSLSTLDEKVAAFLDQFARWRRLARQTSLSHCLEAVLNETHYAEWLLTQPRGDQRHANIQRLLGLARQFDKFQRQGLFRFLCLIEAQCRADAEPVVEAVGAENSVRLMSIHQSKGLEFPVVFVADLGKRFNLSDLSAEIILDEDYGLCPQIKPPQTGKRYPSLPYWLARRRQLRELLGEEMRLLYVAMTRARDALFLSASMPEARLEKVWQRGRNDDSVELTSARSVADWLSVWFSEHCVEKPPIVSGANHMLRWFVHDKVKPAEPEATAECDAGQSGVESLPETLIQRISWEYPFQSATHSPAKASVTALRRRAALPQDEDAVPLVAGPIAGTNTEEFASRRARRDRAATTQRAQKQRAAADAGSAHHGFLQLVSLEKTGSLGELKAEGERLVRQQALTEEAIAMLEWDALAAFWSSELGQRIRDQARYVHRELPFTARFSSQALAEITRQRPEPVLQDEFVIVQGVADLVTLLPKEIWLVDFKTDKLKPREVPKRSPIYEPQMKLYARALAQIYGRPVTDCRLYFLRPGIEVALPTAGLD